METTGIRLTAFSHGAGCACKLSSAELAGVLGHMRLSGLADHPDVLVGYAGSDDAGVYRLSSDLALVHTADFFTPIVDDPGDWGRIAAANALSDVYAMGGRPVTALNLVAWPRDALPFDLLAAVLDGAGEILREAGCALVGGHSIDDAEPKFGLAVTGVVPPDQVTTNSAARPGDTLVLTKALGTGVITTALQRDASPPDAVAAAVAAMTTLNAGAAEAARAAGVRAATDVTGFGFVGHLTEMVRASGVAAEVDVDAVPVLPHVKELISAGMVPGGTLRNLADAADVDWGVTAEEDRVLLCDAQTSGGLLLAAPPGREVGVGVAVGRVLPAGEAPPGTIRVR